MNNKPIILVIVAVILLPTWLFAQFEEAFKYCDKVFDVVETLPDFKKGITALEDSLATFLMKHDTMPKNGTKVYSFVITKKAQVMDIVRRTSDPETDNLYVDFLNSTSGQWIPAKQNSDTVCANICMQMQFAGNKVKVKLFNGTYQPGP